MISHHGVAGSDDPDESRGAAADNACDMLLVQDYRHHPGAIWQNSKGREIARRIHGSDPGTEVLPWSASIDVQVRQCCLSLAAEIISKKVLEFLISYKDVLSKDYLRGYNLLLISFIHTREFIVLKRYV